MAQKQKVDALNPILNNLQPKLPQAKNVQDRVPEAALSIKDPLGMQKEVADLTMQLKQLFFENKQAKKFLGEAESAKRKAQINFEKIMTERNLLIISPSSRISI